MLRSILCLDSFGNSILGTDRDEEDFSVSASALLLIYVQPLVLSFITNTLFYLTLSLFIQYGENTL